MPPKEKILGILPPGSIIREGVKYTDKSPLEYYNLGKEKAPMHPKTRELLEKLLNMLAKEGEDITFGYIKKELLR